MDVFNIDINKEDSNDNNCNDQVTINKEFIDKVIIDMNDILIRFDEVLEINIFVGSALCLMSHFRESTFDIDILADDNVLVNKLIKELNYSKDLINTEVGTFISFKQDFNLYKEMSNLKVYIPTIEFLLAMKCRACRQKDLEDIVKLCEIKNITNLKELESIFKKYYSSIFWNRFIRSDNFDYLCEVIF